MKFEHRGPNETLVRFANRGEILISYTTPVAGWKDGVGFFKTNEHYSATTSKHIRRYLGNAYDSALLVSPDVIERFGDEAGASEITKGERHEPN